MTVALPPLSTIINDSSLPLIPYSQTTQGDAIFSPLKEKSQLQTTPRLPLILPSHSALHDDHGRRVSTCSLSSAPSLTYSPSPSPPPPCRQTASPESFWLVPCAIQRANAVIVLPSQSSIARDGRSPGSPSPIARTSTPTFRACKPSEARAILLIGPAISAHVRRCAASGARKMHPYRIVRDRIGSRRMDRETPSSVYRHASGEMTQ